MGVWRPRHASPPRPPPSPPTPRQGARLFLTHCPFPGLCRPSLPQTSQIWFPDKMQDTHEIRILVKQCVSVSTSQIVHRAYIL